mmetsp:Transcript_12089/g.34206  ORF Transcript_12089/g.34206 Transcript_12089/m.34206 type:complete len:244 (-) Transcript_12089:689-1420(-)
MQPGVLFHRVRGTAGDALPLSDLPSWLTAHCSSGHLGVSSRSLRSSFSRSRGSCGGGGAVVVLLALSSTPPLASSSPEVSSVLLPQLPASKPGSSSHERSPSQSIRPAAMASTAATWPPKTPWQDPESFSCVPVPCTALAASAATRSARRSARSLSTTLGRACEQIRNSRNAVAPCAWNILKRPTTSAQYVRHAARTASKCRSHSPLAATSAFASAEPSHLQRPKKTSRTKTPNAKWSRRYLY